jgi:hypothetical protein
LTAALQVILVIGCALLAICHASLAEWVFHRYWLHRPWLPKGCFTSHTLVHHQLCKFDDTFQVKDVEQHEALTFQWWGGPTLIALNVLVWIPVTWALGATHVLPWWGASLVSAIALVVFGLYYAGYEGFHYLMHKPSIPWIERSKLFRFLERHHRIHHARTDRNFNVLAPLADIVLGTFTLDMAIPVTTSPKARAIARRHSQFGKRLRGDR